MVLHEAYDVEGIPSRGKEDLKIAPDSALECLETSEQINARQSVPYAREFPSAGFSVGTEKDSVRIESGEAALAAGLAGMNLSIGDRLDHGHHIDNQGVVAPELEVELQ